MGYIFLTFATIWGLLSLYLYSLGRKEKHLKGEIDRLDS